MHDSHALNEYKIIIWTAGRSAEADPAKRKSGTRPPSLQSSLQPSLQPPTAWLTPAAFPDTSWPQATGISTNRGLHQLRRNKEHPLSINFDDRITQKRRGERPSFDPTPTRQSCLAERRVHSHSLPNCYAKLPLCMRALHCAPITFESREIHSGTYPNSAMNHFTGSGNDAGVCLKGKGK